MTALCTFAEDAPRPTEDDGVRDTGVWAQLNALPVGCHEVAITEGEVWSAPFPFCVEAITLRVTAF